MRAWNGEIKWRDVADLGAREINSWGGLRPDTSAMLETNGQPDYPVDGASWRVNESGTEAEVIYSSGERSIRRTVRFLRYPRLAGLFSVSGLRLQAPAAAHARVWTRLP